MVKVPDTIVDIERIAAGGEGIGRLDGKAVFVRLTAPGDRIRCRITGEHKTWARAELTEILAPSPERVTPPCPHYGICGGCEFQHLNYEAQIAAKTAILKDAFTRISGIQPPEPEIFPSAPFEYRNRMQFHLAKEQRAKSKEQGTGNTGIVRPEYAAGLKARKSAEVIPISDCPIAVPGIRSFLRNAAPGLAPIAAAKERFTVFSHADVFLSEGGIEQGKISLLERELYLDVSVFFQSNTAMLEKAIRDLQRIAASADHRAPMADLYCGAGTFAAFLGEGFPRIDLLEENPQALALARKNMEGASGAVEFFQIPDKAWPALQRRDHSFIIADPPRQGLAPNLAASLAAGGPPVFAYLSCDPASLARDSKILCSGGYRLSSLALYDFYPQTSHIESLAVFLRQ